MMRQESSQQSTNGMNLLPPIGGGSLNGVRNDDTGSGLMSREPSAAGPGLDIEEFNRQRQHQTNSGQSLHFEELY